MLAGKITSDFLTAIIEVRVSYIGACAEYKYFNFISSRCNFTGLLLYITNVGKLKGEFESEPHVSRERLFCYDVFFPKTVGLIYVSVPEGNPVGCYQHNCEAVNNYILKF